MALEFPRESKPQGLVADRALGLAEDWYTLVDDGAPNQRFVLVGAPGVVILQDAVDRLGLYLDAEGKVQQRKAEAPVSWTSSNPAVATVNAPSEPSAAEGSES